MDATKIPFNSLPSRVQESLLWDMELEYDAYESSKPATIHGILCGNIDSTNKTAIVNYYKALSADSLRVTIAYVAAEAQGQLDGCRNTLSKLDIL